MDKIQRAMLYDNQVTAAVADTTELVNKAIQIHKMAPTAAAALGRTLTAAAMMSYDLDAGDSLTVTISGSGPLGNLVVSADSDAKVRGYADAPQTDLALNAVGKLDVAGAVGLPGTMTVVKSMGLKQPYVGRIELVSGEIGEDFAYYFAVSEQKPSAIALGVLIDRDGSCASAGGVLLHVLPGAEDWVIDEIQNSLAPFSAISSLLKEKSPEEIIETGFSGSKVLTDVIYPKFCCKCSQDSIERVLLSLGRAENEEILKKEGIVEVKCHFCGTKYRFQREQIEELFEKAAARGK